MLRIGSEFLGQALRHQCNTQGLQISAPSDYPWFPSEIDPQSISLGLDTCGNDRPHDCRTAPARVHVGLVLVFDGVIWDGYARCMRRNAVSFRPYYTLLCYTHEGGSPPDPAVWEDANWLEIASAIAQHPGHGSFRAHGAGWHQPSCQAYVAPSHEAIVVHCFGSGQEHHRAYVRRGMRQVRCAIA